MKEQLEKQEMKTSHAYYICWYIADEDNETYKGNVTGVLKMKYVISQMQASGISPYVVSLAQPAKKGCLSGDKLDAYLFGCHIGLSSNVMRPHFANNSFPSKVVTYMCHDLSVVLGYAEAFYDVPMSEGWTFYHAFTAPKIAEAIMSAHVVPEGYYHDRIHKMNNALQRFLYTFCVR